MGKKILEIEIANGCNGYRSDFSKTKVTSKEGLRSSLVLQIVDNRVD
jgi:hypothetical protein